MPTGEEDLYLVESKIHKQNLDMPQAVICDDIWTESKHLPGTEHHTDIHDGKIRTGTVSAPLNAARTPSAPFLKNLMDCLKEYQPFLKIQDRLKNEIKVAYTQLPEQRVGRLAANNSQQELLNMRSVGTGAVSNSVHFNPSIVIALHKHSFDFPSMQEVWFYAEKKRC